LTSSTRASTQRDVGTYDGIVREERAGSINWLGWSVTVGGVAAIGAAGLLALRASKLDDESNMSPDTNMRNDLRDQAGTRRVMSAVAGVGGLVLTATGVYLLVTQSHDRAARVSVNVGVTGRGVVVFGRF
jgi:hypothetical protein